jgi:tellurite resistance protein
MPAPAPIVALGASDPDQIARAVHKVVTADGARAARLVVGASQSAAAEPSDVDSARWFQSLVELAWLVASTDGFDPAERASMATLLATVSGTAVDHEALEQHLAELAEQVDVMGRTQRLARAAAELHDQASGSDALTFAALVAMADGRLEAIELDALVTLGGFLDIPAGEVRSLVTAVAADVEANLR